MKRDAVINIRIPRELKNLLAKAAEQDHGRSMSGMLVRILEEWFEQHGYLGSTTTKAKSKRS